MSDGLQAYVDSKDLEGLSKTVNKLFEGVRSEVLFAVGFACCGKTDTCYGCHSFPAKGQSRSHANIRGFVRVGSRQSASLMEWWHLGKAGDNWSNQTVEKRGHMLLDRTVAAVEMATSGMLVEVREE